MVTTTRAFIASRTNISEDIVDFVLMPDKYTRFESGQFMQVAIGEVNAYDIWPDSRAFSIASPYDRQKKSLRVIVRKGTSFTVRLIEGLGQGDLVTIRYPLGDFFLEDDTDNLVFIAGGTGITPFLSYINSHKESEFNGKIFLFYTGKYLKDLIDYEALLAHSREQSKFHIKIYLTREEVNSAVIINGRVTGKSILETVREGEKAKYYICGPNQFIKDLTEQLREEGVKHIYSEIWD